MITHNEYEFDSGNKIEVVEYPANSDHMQFQLQGKIHYRDFGVSVGSLEEANTVFYSMITIIRQIT